MNKYQEFLKAKMAISHNSGFDISPEEITPSLYPHVKDTVRWAIRGGCRAIFSSFGMQKTVTQLEIIRIILKHQGGKGLVVCPKRVVIEFLQQAKRHLGLEVTYVRTMQEVESCPTDIMITNYERVRDGEDGVRIEPAYFTVASLDEASVLRGFGTKTYQEFLPLFATVPYCAVRMGRRGLSTELNYDYWKDCLPYLAEAEQEVSAPTLFDLMETA